MPQSNPDFRVTAPQPGQNWLDVQLEPPPYMSASSIETFRQCPLKYKLSRIDKIADPPTFATVLGNFVHSVMEDLFFLPPEERKLSVVRPLLAGRWESEYRLIADSIGADHSEMKWKAFWCLENYFGMEDPTLIEVRKEQIETELGFSVPGEDEKRLVEVAGVPIKGYVDQWREYRDGILVRDWKTGKSPKPRYREGKFFQLLIYADALSSMLDMPTRRISLYYVADGFKLEKNVTEKEIEEMRAVVASVRSAVLERCETGEFEPIKQVLCDWCSYQSICPVWVK